MTEQTIAELVVEPEDESGKRVPHLMIYRTTEPINDPVYQSDGSVFEVYDLINEAICKRMIITGHYVGSESGGFYFHHKYPVDEVMEYLLEYIERSEVQHNMVDKDSKVDIPRVSWTGLVDGMQQFQRPKG